MQEKRCPKVFICYRRADAAESAARLHETLVRRFGTQHIFWDTETIEGGDEFDAVIQEALSASKVVLAVIGRDWLTAAQGDKRRLDNANDPVRLEIATALRRGVRVIPVLVEGASLPREEDLPDEIKRLVSHQGISLSPGNWRYDAKPLTRTIEKDFTRSYPYSIFFGAIAGLIAGIIFGVIYARQQEIEIPLARLIAGAAYGALAGAVFCIAINAGINCCLKLLRWSSYANILGGALGGAIGGVLMAIIGALSFSWQEGQAVTPMYVAVAVGLSTFFIAFGNLLPELWQDWYKRLVILFTLALVTTAMLLLTAGLLQTQLKNLQPQLESATPISAAVLLLGLVCGVMAGLQVGLALFVYDRSPKLEK